MVNYETHGRWCVWYVWFLLIFKVGSFSPACNAKGNYRHRQNMIAKFWGTSRGKCFRDTKLWGAGVVCYVFVYLEIGETGFGSISGLIAPRAADPEVDLYFGTGTFYRLQHELVGNLVLALHFRHPTSLCLPIMTSRMIMQQVEPDHPPTNLLNFMTHRQSSCRCEGMLLDIIYRWFWTILSCGLVHQHGPLLYMSLYVIQFFNVLTMARHVFPGHEGSSGTW